MNVTSPIVVFAAGVMAILTGAAHAAPLPLKEERLGAWHYLYPLEYYEGGTSKHQRPVDAPTAATFDSRIAAFVPGSDMVAEFVDGKFERLPLPDSFAPVSLSVDRGGSLYCLLGKQSEFIKTQKDAKSRWFSSWKNGAWSMPVSIPFDNCDRIEFDSKNRLWALGKSSTVAVWLGSAWYKYTYSEDKQREFKPIRMSENENGDVILFSYTPSTGDYGALSGMDGILVYKEWKFVREPKADATVWIMSEQKRMAELRDDGSFDRKTGYVCRKEARNGLPHAAATVLMTPRYVLVSFGDDGLAWAEVADLKNQPPLSETAEWESIDDLILKPAFDSQERMWFGRDNPSRLVIVSKEKTQEIPGNFRGGQFGTIDFDQLGRAWIADWHGSTEGNVAISDGSTLKQYSSYMKALKGEAKAFKAGRILPWAVKTPKGDIGSGCGFFDKFAILDGKGEHSFEAAEINPDEPYVPRPRHGYNPFRDCWPWYDKGGRIYAKVNEHSFYYQKRKWHEAKQDAEKNSMVPPVPSQWGGDIVAPFETQVKSAEGRVLIFRGFHFYEKKEEQLVQVDTGLNPLAYYPFWTGWYSSPGQTSPVLDPVGRIWVSPLGPYAEYRKWCVLRKPLPD